MAGTDPTLWTLTEQAAAIARRQLGSVELLDAHLARVEQLNPQVNAVCTLAVDRAREQARAADEMTARGESNGPLHGLSVTIKDALETAGIRSTGGSTELADYVPTTDAPAVERVRTAGAIVYGKTNLPEWSGDLQTSCEMFGTTNNPWRLSHTAGGSSGGAAAAVATGMTSFEIGTDIGGSVRFPSAMCGIVGHKPSWGIIPTFGYLDTPAGGTTELDVNVFGPMTRSTADAALLLDLLAGPDPVRAPAWRLELPRSTVTGPSALRVAVWFDEPAVEIDDELRIVLHNAADDLEAAGASVDRNARPAIDVALAAREGMMLISAALALREEGGSAEVAQRLRHVEWQMMNRRRAERRARWAELFAEGFDVVLCPVTVTPAFPHLLDGNWYTRQITINGRERRYADLEAWPALIGSVLLPSTSVPVGRTADGLPVGVQVVAPYLHDHTALTVAGLLADITGVGYQVPPIVTGAPG